MRGKLRVEMLSDTCFSMPSDLNVAVDQEAFVDDLGLPAVPGTTLHGLIRDTWLSCQGEFDDCETLGYNLFGAPQQHGPQGKISIGEAKLTEDIHSRVRWAIERVGNPMPPEAMREAFFSTRMQTAVDRISGAPATDTLRGLRVVPRGTVLHAPIRVLGQISENEGALFELLLRLTRHAGLDRNRGLGHVKLSVTWDDPGPNAMPMLDNLGSIELLRYHMRLTAPCIVHAKDLDPNSCSTLAHIPGEAIRGAVAAALVRKVETHDVGSETRTNAEAALDALINRGYARFLTAYPEDESSGDRCTPAPITWQRDKDARYNDNESTCNPYNAAVELFNDGYAPRNTQRQPLSSEYVATDGVTYTAHSHSEYVQRNTHQTRFREMGISEVGKSTVYIYEAIAANTTLSGCVAAPSGLHAALKSILESGDLYIGRSSRTQYGGAPEIEVMEGPAGTDELGRRAIGAVEQGGRFEVVLTSPAVLRNPNTGQHDPSQLGSQAENLFVSKAKLVAACVKQFDSSGYVRQWRTELPRVPAAGAGSVAVLEALEAIDGDTLLSVQSQPLGERTEGGNGAFVIFAQSEDIYPLNSKPGLMKRPEEPSTKPDDYLRVAQEQLYQSLIHRQLAAYAVAVASDGASSLRSAGRKLPSAHILQRLRRPLRSADWAETYLLWFSPPAAGQPDMRLRQTARQPIERCMIGNMSLSNLLLEAAAGRWPTTVGSTDEMTRQKYRMVSSDQADRIWAIVLERNRPLFIDRFLSCLARGAKEQEA